MSQNKQYSVYLIIEGNEEETFFEIVKEFGVSQKITLDWKNAGIYGGVAPHFHNAMGEEHDCVVCVYDVDYESQNSDSAYNNTKKGLIRILGSEEKAKAVSFCTNPNILQIILLCCDSLDNVALHSSSKKTNTPIVHKYWDDIGKNSKNAKGQKISANYRAAKWQLDKIKNSFEYGQYKYLNVFKNASTLSQNYLDSKSPGSNLPLLLKALYDGNIDYFEKINKYLNKNEKNG